MSILAECPTCKQRQSLKNKLCRACHHDLDQAKRSGTVRYWITYRTESGTQRKELIGTSIEEARAADGKRRAQKWEQPSVLEKIPGDSTTVADLVDWYLKLHHVKSLKSFERVEDCLGNFRAAFGSVIVGRLRPVDLENYQHARIQAGAALATVDMELSIAKTMINKAFDNDLLAGHTLRAFRLIKRQLKPKSNARDRILAPTEYLTLLSHAPAHLKQILAVAYNTGMRRGEITGLTWSMVDHTRAFFRLPADLTKEKKPKVVPINKHVAAVLDALPTGLPQGHVFRYRKEPIFSIRKSLASACAQAGIPYGLRTENGFRFHDIRTTVKTNMLRAGVDKAIRDTILGHALTGMDAYYLRPSEADLRRAMTRFTAWLDRELKRAAADLSKNTG